MVGLVHGTPTPLTTTRRLPDTWSEMPLMVWPHPGVERSPRSELELAPGMTRQGPMASLSEMWAEEWPDEPHPEAGAPQRSCCMLGADQASRSAASTSCLGSTFPPGRVRGRATGLQVFGVGGSALRLPGSSSLWPRAELRAGDRTRALRVFTALFSVGIG